MNESNNEQELPEYPKIHYTSRGERFIDCAEFLMSKTGRKSLRDAIKLEIFLKEKNKND